MIKRAWRWLFQRHKPAPTVSGISRGASAWLYTSMRQQDAFAQDFEDDPMMCAPVLESRRTAHITRVIDAQTIPIASIASDETQASRTPYAFYASETMADEHATQPLQA